MQTMSTADAAFLYAETPTAPMHVGTAGVFDGPPPAFDDVIAMLERKLPLLPRYRQRVRFVPNDLGRPGWRLRLRDRRHQRPRSAEADVRAGPRAARDAPVDPPAIRG